MARRPDVHALLSELAKRPALNGGWSKLQRQQKLQLKRLRALESQFANFVTWGKRFFALIAFVATTAAGVVIREIVVRVLH